MKENSTKKKKKK